MKFVPKYIEVSNDAIREYERTQVVASAALPVTNVKQILSLCAQAAVTGVEALQGEAVLQGKVNYRLLYLDAENAIQGLDYLSDFQNRVHDSEVFAGQRLFACAEVIEKDCVIEGDFVKVSAVLELGYSGIVKENLTVLASAEGAFVRTAPIKLKKEIAGVTAAFEAVEEFEYGTELLRVLAFDSALLIKGYRAGDNSFFAQGEASVCVTALTERGIESRSFRLPFEEEIALAGTTADSEIFAVAYVKNTRLNLLTDSGQGAFSVEITVDVTAAAFSTVTVEAVSDLYSTEELLTAEKECVCISTPSQERSSEEKLSAMLQLEEGRSGVREVLATAGVCDTMTGITAADDYVSVTGIVSGAVLYLDYEDNYNSLYFEAPFAFKLSLNGVREGDEASVGVIITDCTARARRDRELELAIDLAVAVQTRKTACSGFVTAVSAVPQSLEQLSAISVYCAKKDDTLWDIAKQLSCSIDTVAALNPSLGEGKLNGGERVAIFRHLEL